MKTRNPFLRMMGLMAASVGFGNTATVKIEADLNDSSSELDEHRWTGKTRYAKTSPINQRQIRKNRRRAFANGNKLAFSH